jgi:hypothetical protein
MGWTITGSPQLERKEKMTDKAMIDIRDVYYYEKSPCVGNSVTVCLFLDEKSNLLIARGISICSIYDQFSKDEGRRKSYKRARNALGKKCTSLEIKKMNNFDDFDDYVLRRKRVKNIDEERAFVDEIREFKNIDFKVIQNGEKKYVQYELPYLHPIEITLKQFKYKSYYRPNPTNREIDEFRTG